MSMIGEDTRKGQAFAWQVIVVQARGGESPNSPTVPLQTTISYGDQKESTALVDKKQPLWNFWTQMPDRGGKEPMVFSLSERDTGTGKISVKGEARLDLAKYRRCGKSFELWQALKTTGHEGGDAPTEDVELYLTISYCASDFGEFESTDCHLWPTMGTSGECSIS